MSAQETYLASGPQPGDEWFDAQENRLREEKLQIGQAIADCCRGWRRWLPKYRKLRARQEVKLLQKLGELAELREIRRCLLGTGFTFHIRPRATPNFVADNPAYKKVVAAEHPELES